MNTTLPPPNRENSHHTLLEAVTDFAEMGEAQRKEFWAALALKHTEGLGPKGAANLLKAYGSAYAAILASGEWRRHNISEPAIQAFKSESWRGPAGKEWGLAKQPHTNILLWTNPHYPQTLKEIPTPPVFLYAKGNIELLSYPGVGVVGARRASPDALAASHRLASELSKAGVTVISGMARGVDSKAHKAALDGPGGTVAVLGCGLDVYYPPENKNLQDRIAASGLLLSEYPGGTKPEAFHFPIRNRIISALSLGILVVEAAGRSGSLITASLALEYGREVFAMPGKFAASKAQGSHELIRRGAKPVLDLEDVLIELLPRLKGFSEFGKQALAVGEILASADAEREQANERHAKNTAKKTTNPPAEKTEKRLPPETCPPEGEGDGSLTANIMELLKSEGPLQADSICVLLNLPAAKVSGKLLLLELEGEIRRYPGMIYALP